MENPRVPQWVNGGLRMYLVDRTALAYLGEICALDDESGSEGSAAQICSKGDFQEPTEAVEKRGVSSSAGLCDAFAF